MVLPIKFSDTPPYYNGYWHKSDFSSGYIKHLVSVRSGRMYLCTSIPENTLPAKFLLSYKLKEEWYNAMILPKELFKLIDTTHLGFMCVFTRDKGRLSIYYKGSTYPLYWKQTNTTELHLLELF